MLPTNIMSTCCQTDSHVYKILNVVKHKHVQTLQILQCCLTCTALQILFSMMLLTKRTCETNFTNILYVAKQTSQKFITLSRHIKPSHKPIMLPTQSVLYIKPSEICQAGQADSRARGYRDNIT